MSSAATRRESVSFQPPERSVTAAGSMRVTLRCAHAAVVTMRATVAARVINRTDGTVVIELAPASDTHRRPRVEMAARFVDYYTGLFGKVHEAGRRRGASSCPSRR